MQAYFDPYYQWLGIWPHEQPADHYRLLGLPRFERDPAVITQAAELRSAHVNLFRQTAQAESARWLLAELALAQLTLLDPARRSAYDAMLQSMSPAVTAETQAWPGSQRPGTAAAGGPVWPVEAVRPAEPPAQPLVAAAPAHPPGPAKPAGPAPIRIPATAPITSAAKSGELPPGALIGRFRILERVGASSLGSVYKVQDTHDGRLFFLKLLPPSAAKNVEVQKRFQREIEIITKLDHPNLISGRESGTHEERPYLIMDYVMGTDLATLVKQQGRLTADDAAAFIAQAARGLVQLHLHGVTHRNLKPHVLLIDVKGNVRITNLLLAKIGEASTFDAGDEALTMQGEQMGTMDYLPPEQALDPRSVDGRSDIYALGCTLFFLLIGRPPYIAKSTMEKMLAHRQAPIPLLRNLRDDVQEWLDEVSQKMLAKKPYDRFQSASDLLDALDRRRISPVSSGNARARPSWWERLWGMFRPASEIAR